MKNWLDKYIPQAQNGIEGTMSGLTDKGFNYNGAWGGQFQTGGAIPGSVGFTYARTGSIPSEGPYAKKTLPSAQNGQEMKYYQEGLDWKPKTISRNGSWLNKYEQAQDGKKKFKLKDERLQAIRPSESTFVKKPNFEAEQAKVQRTYVDQVGKQMAEEKRRSKLTKEQREREDYNAMSQQTGSIQTPVEESTWDRSKAIVSNPLTAFGYVARNESLPTRFQYGDRNTLDYAVDWVNPLQGIASASEIPAELGRGEYLNAGLSALDALDLGVYARGAKKTLEPVVKKGMNQLGNIRTSVAPELRQGVIANGFSLNDLNPFKFKPKSDRLYTELDDKNIVEEFLGKSNITNAQKKVWTNKPEMKAKYLLEADPKNEVFSNGLSTYDIPLDHLQGSNIYKKNWLGNYKRIEPTSYFSTDWNGKDLNPFVEPQRVQYSDFIHPEQAADLAHETRNDYENLFGMSMPESPTRSNDLYPDVQNNWMTDAIERNAMKRYIYQKSMMPESWEGFYDKFRGNYNWDIKHFPERKAEFDLNFIDITPEEKNHLFNNIQVQKQGGVIKDDRGQWTHPGKITEINSPYITMQGVPYPVLGISDTGDTKLMKPGKNYKFKGKKVTEFPMAKNGVNQQDEKTLQHLDQLTNFTNYNKPSGWMDKYK